MSHAELKALETRKRKVNAKLRGRKEEQVVLSREINQLIKNIGDLHQRIEKLKTNEIETNKSITVTEHAILRYLERVRGIDIEEVKREIAPPTILLQIRALGAGSYPCTSPYKTPFRIRVRDNAVITVLTKE